MSRPESTGLHDLAERLVRRRRGNVFLTTAFRSSIFIAGLGLSGAVLLRSTRPDLPLAERTILLSVFWLGGVALGAIAAFVAARWLVRLTPLEAAIDADRRLDLADRLGSGLALWERRGEAMVDSLLNDAIATAGSVDPEQLLPRPSRRPLLYASGLIGLSVIVTLLEFEDRPLAPPTLAAAATTPAAGEGRSAPPEEPANPESPSSRTDPGPDQEKPPPEPDRTENEKEPGNDTPDDEEPGPESEPEERGTNPGLRPGHALFGDPAETAPLTTTDVVIDSMFSPGDPILRQARVHRTVGGPGAVPGAGLTPLTPELHREFERRAEEEILNANRTESDRILVRRYFESIRPPAPPRR